MHSTLFTDNILLHDEQASHGLHRLLLDYLAGQPPGLLLDVGCGTGSLASRVRDLWAREVHALELRREYVTHPGLAVREHDLDSLAPFPYQDGTFDYILLVEVIEHLKHPWHATGELSRLLRPGGRLIVTTPNVHHLRSKLKLLLGHDFFGFGEDRRSSPLSHLISFTRRQMRLIMHENGLTIEDELYSDPFMGKLVPASDILHPGRDLSPALSLARYLARNGQYLLSQAGSLLLTGSADPKNIHFGASMITVGRK